jgi:hypothetical protein
MNNINMNFLKSEVDYQRYLRKQAQVELDSAKV